MGIKLKNKIQLTLNSYLFNFVYNLAYKKMLNIFQIYFLVLTKIE